MSHARTLILALALVVVGCAAEAPSSARAPLEDPRPLGIGWYCAHGVEGPPLSFCERVPTACATKRASLAPSNPRLGECGAHPTAMCFAYRTSSAPSTRYECFMTSGDCLVRRNRALADAANDDVSPCNAWD